MQFIGILLLFGGYTLVYAATAHGGVFATEPWAALYADAYINAGDPYDIAALQAKMKAAGSGGIGTSPVPQTTAAGPGGRIKGRPRG